MRRTPGSSRSPLMVTLITSVASITAGGMACSNGHPGSPPPPNPGDAGTIFPFQADQPVTYVAKVKNILVGLPPTDDEVQRVTADPTQLATLIDGWMLQPEYVQKMKRFFELAFQQTQVTAVDFSDQAYPKQIGINNTTIPLLVQNATFAWTKLPAAAFVLTALYFFLRAQERGARILLARVEEHGDLYAGSLAEDQELPELG